METLFRPAMLARPGRGSGGTIYEPLSNFEETDRGRFRSKDDGLVVELYEALEKSLSSDDRTNVIGAFATHQFYFFPKIGVGTTEILEVDIPDDYGIFCVELPAGVMGNVDQGEHLFPYLLGTARNTATIGTTAHPYLERLDGTRVQGPQGKLLQMQVTVFVRRTANSSGWEDLLFESLNDFNNLRRPESIFKLAVSIELWAQNIIEKYLNTKGLPESILQVIDRAARNWDQQLEIVSSLAATLELSAEENRLSKEATKLFKEKVRSVRNDFSHRIVADLIDSDVSTAYLAALPLLWSFEKVAKHLSDIA